jgi:hypothetical protein
MMNKIFHNRYLQERGTDGYVRSALEHAMQDGAQNVETFQFCLASVFCRKMLHVITPVVTVRLDLNFIIGFDVFGSVHLQVQLDVHYILYFFLDNVSSTCFRCYLHPSSGAQLQRTAVGLVWFCVLFHWNRYWFSDTFTLKHSQLQSL